MASRPPWRLLFDLTPTSVLSSNLLPSLLFTSARSPSPHCPHLAGTPPTPVAPVQIRRTSLLPSPCSLHDASGSNAPELARTVEVLQDQRCSPLSGDAAGIVVLRVKRVPEIAAYDHENETIKIQLSETTQQKVDALMLLSQQEERENLKVHEVNVLNDRVRALQEQLAQATEQKVQGLMVEAELRKEKAQWSTIEKDLRHQIKNANNLASTLLSEDSTRPPGPPKRSWFSRRLSGGSGASPASSPQADDPAARRGSDPRIGELSVENVELKEQLANMQRLAMSARRLRMSLVSVEGVAAKTSTSSDVGSLDALIEEVRMLQFAFNMTTAPAMEPSVDGETALTTERLTTDCDPREELVALLAFAASLRKELMSVKMMDANNPFVLSSVETVGNASWSPETSSTILPSVEVNSMP
ncbi:hypothetical protein CYMTET_53126 [Cymbomonas tetramitiformis]|uniref:Uncharacterized protein n=1 Tax=Cymbomonas tetramitiformis TaxID=36881 RepID=A0AAE0BJ14_9CHLO|nr:hypothetical protein CYMTET_53126 [Cymbomonas tetramitiformis]